MNTPIELFGIMLVGLGISLIVAAIKISREEKASKQSTSLEAKAAELMKMPAHERIARNIARSKGCPEFAWRNFTPEAVAYLLREGQ
jgi:hypothetical protein